MRYAPGGTIIIQFPRCIRRWMANRWNKKCDRIRKKKHGDKLCFGMTAYDDVGRLTTDTSIDLIGGAFVDPKEKDDGV